MIKYIICFLIWLVITFTNGILGALIIQVLRYGWKDTKELFFKPKDK